MPDSINTLLEKAVYRLAGNSPSPQIDAEVLLSHVLNKSRSFLRAWSEHIPNPTETDKFLSLLEERSKGCPIAYLIGKREFWSREFFVNQNVLIPRPDSELLIELSLNHLLPTAPYKVLDLGTGSGILAITLAAERPNCTVIATDSSKTALDIAKRNAEALRTPNVQFQQSDWLSNIDDNDFDLIVSNPPYIDQNDRHLFEGDLRFEPAQALVSPNKGLHDLNTIIFECRRHIKPGGLLMVEHGYNQGSDVRSLFEQFNYQSVHTYPDLAGNARVTQGVWTSS